MLKIHIIIEDIKELTSSVGLGKHIGVLIDDYFKYLNSKTQVSEKIRLF